MFLQNLRPLETLSFSFKNTQDDSIINFYSDAESYSIHVPLLYKFLNLYDKFDGRQSDLLSQRK